MFEAIVWNEASLPFKSVEDCERNIESFFDLLHNAKLNNIQFTRVDDTEGEWSHLNYAEDFAFGHWLNRIEDKERQRQVKSVLSSVKCPLSDINRNKQQQNLNNILFILAQDEGQEVLGLAFASLNESHSISFNSDDIWGNELIPILKLWDESGTEYREPIDVPNISKLEQLKPLIDSFRSKRFQNNKYLDELKSKDNEDFRNLLFTSSAIKSFRSTAIQPLDFRKILEVFCKLSESIVDSDSLEALVINSGLDISGESDSTMSSKTLVRLRTFKHPLFGPQVFEIHVKNFNGGKRMHILPDYEMNTICIGYFGKHLKTSNS